MQRMPESDPEKRRQWEQREKEETSCVASFMGPQMTDVVIWFSICTPAYYVCACGAIPGWIHTTFATAAVTSAAVFQGHLPPPPPSQSINCPASPRPPSRLRESPSSIHSSHTSGGSHKKGSRKGCCACNALMTEQGKTRRQL